MSEYEVDPEELRDLVRRSAPRDWELSVVVDFTTRLYVNGFREVPIHQYVPGQWRGIEDVPLKYVPDSVRAIWA